MLLIVGLGNPVWQQYSDCNLDRFRSNDAGVFSFIYTLCCCHCFHQAGVGRKMGGRRCLLAVRGCLDCSIYCKIYLYCSRDVKWMICIKDGM